MPVTDTATQSRTITALFDSREAADRAVADLETAGIPRQHLDIVAGGDGTSSATEPHGFWETLRSLFLPDDDRHSYAEGLRRGGFLVSVQADEANYNRVIDILDRDGATNLDEREETWRSEGWTGTTMPVGTSPDLVQPVTASMPGAPVADLGRTAPTAADELRSMTRDADLTRNRVRSYSAGAVTPSAPFGFASSQIVEHMDVISADGQKIGTVDHLDGPDRIKLAKSTSPDGQHHYVPFTWIDHVDQHVHLKKTLADIKAST